MTSLKIALLQILPEDSLEGNLQKGLAACRQAKSAGAEIALFPEMWSVGYRIASDEKLLRSSAIELRSPFIDAFCALAKKLDMAIGITFLEAYEPSPRNALCLVDRFGNIVLHYAKVHTCDFGEERALTAGDDFYVAELDTAKGIVKVGAMICYDREFPESARILMLKGAEIILVPNACPMEINRLAQLRARAYENMLGITTANYPVGQPDCNGRSSVFDGVAYLPAAKESRVMQILYADESEGIFVADFDIKMLREYRRTEVHGNAYRHPDKYQILTSKKIEEPFLRTDYRK